MVLLIVSAGGLASGMAYLSPETPGSQISLDELADLLSARRVAEATLLDQDNRVAGKLTPAHDAKAFWAAYPENDATASRLITDLTAAGARVVVDPQTKKWSVRMLTTAVLPLVILAILFGLFFSGGGSGAGMGEVMDFSRLSKVGRTGGAVTFSDVGGLDEAIVELREVVDYLKNRQRYAAVGAVVPKGLLLLGPPGCGKTLLAKAVAGEAGVPFFSVAGAEFVESLVGVGAARVRDLFRKVAEAAPAIVFIDELDAAGRRRGAGGAGGGSEEREQTLNQLLVEMDGFEVSSGIVVIAATNRPDILDPALLRPGRFDRRVLVDKPDLQRREEILALHARGRRIGSGVDLALIARRTPGFTGADLASVVNEAALLALRESKQEIDAAAISEAVQRVISGPQRRGHVLSEEERRRVAYHEAGHALAAAALGRAEEVHRVSIVARGRGLGAAGFRREDEAVVYTRGQLVEKMVIALAGKAAEDLVFEESSTGAADDLEQATSIARQMAGRFGMTAGVGPVSLLGAQGDFLGEIAEAALGGAELQDGLDQEIRSLVESAATRASELLAGTRTSLDRLATRLIEEETIEGRALEQMLRETG